MRILHVDLPVKQEPGKRPTLRTLEVSKAMERAGVASSVLTTNHCLPEYVRKLDGTGVSVFNWFCGQSYCPKFRREQLAQVVKPFDLVHIANHWTYLNALVYHACKTHRRPYVICPSGENPATEDMGWLKKFFHALVGMNQFRQAAAYVAINREESACFGEYGIAPGQVTLIPDGINPEEFAMESDGGFRKRLGPGKAPFVLFVGRLGKIDQPDLLLQAYLAEARESLAEYHLVFAGPDFGLKEELKAAAASALLAGRVHFPGYLSREDLVRAYHAADLLVIPSCQTIMPATALETGVCATPVLLTEQCDFADLEAAGGGMVTSASLEGLRAGLKEMCRDRQRLQAMGRELKRYVVAHYSWDHVALQYLELYKKILG